MNRVVALTFVVILGLIVGCNQPTKGAKASATSPGVLDVAPSAPIPSAEPVVAAQPVSDAQPVLYSSNPVAGPSIAAQPAVVSKKSTYTVRKGDTLFSIAKTSYGTGRDWQKIVAANPGLEPSKLKVGQQIVIP